MSLLSSAFKWRDRPPVPPEPMYDLQPDQLQHYLTDLDKMVSGMDTRLTLLEENIRQVQATFDRWAPYLDKLSSTYNALEIDEETKDV